MLAKILAWIASKAGGAFVGRFLDHLEAKANSETERQRIAAAARNASEATAAGVVTAGMQHRAFWVAWLVAALPLSCWFGWGVLDSLANGALPDVAALPPQLLEFARTVWGNIFYSGAALGGASVIAGAVRGRK